MAYKLVETALAQADLDAILSYLALSLEIPPLPQPLLMKLKSATRHWNSCPIFTSSAATLGFLPKATVKLSSSIIC